MRYKNILVTGGAGFIGSFLVDRLVRCGYKVRIYDNLEYQVHRGKKPIYLNPKAEFLQADIRNYDCLKESLEKIDAVFHLAAAVGVQQSQYKIKKFIDVNLGGTANLFDIIVNYKLPVKKIILMASMTIYGEGNCFCRTCGRVKPALRSYKQMGKKDWELHCPNCNLYVKPMPVDEKTPLSGNSIYALTKKVQEEMLFHIGKTYQIPVVSLRGFNVYGPRQSISNPYTGVTAIFIGRLKENKPPVIYEDGLQTRDFISVHDVVEALLFSLTSDKTNYKIMNLGSGQPTTIKKIVEILASLLKKNVKPRMTSEFRKNDIRHCYADMSRTKEILNWEPKIGLEDGLKELIHWAETETSQDLFAKVEKELRDKKLL